LSNVFHQYIRPETIRKAVLFLCGKYPFYDGFNFDLEKLKRIEEHFFDDCEEDLESESLGTVQDEILENEDNVLGDDAEELEYMEKDPVKKNQSNIGCSYFLTPENLPSEVLKKDNKEKVSVTIAPGEGQVPSNILKEKHPFVLHFPCLFPDRRGGLHDEIPENKNYPTAISSSKNKQYESCLCSKQTVCVQCCRLY
jgi:hypothetical protein